MKKSAFALCTLAAAMAPVWAQSSVTVYGIVDAGVSTTSGMTGGTKKHVISGIMDGSRLGFKGTEDLGGGYKALFLLENRLELDTGSNSNTPPSGSQLPERWGKASIINGTFAFNFGALPLTDIQKATLNGTVNGGLQKVVDGVGGALANAAFGVNIGNARFWDRQAYAGLITPVGAVLVGRQYTPAYQVNAEFDTMGTQSSLAAGQVAAVPAVIDIRQSNSVQYRIQQGGFTAGAMVAAGEGGTSQGSFLGAMATYKTGPFGIGLGYNAKKNELNQKSLTTKTLGLSMDIGPGKLSFLYNDVEDKNPSGLSSLLAAYSGGVTSIRSAVAAQPGIGGILAPQINVANLTEQYRLAFVQDSSAMSIGYKATFGPHTIYTAFNRYNDKTRFNADTDSYGAVYTYAFSKRTDVNFVATHFNNKGLGQAAPGQAGFLGGFTATAGQDSNNFAVGLRHRF